MPYLKIQTNVKIEDKKQWMSEVSMLLSEALKKPSQYIMVAVMDQTDMMFANTTDPLAFIELKSIGMPENETGNLSAKICSLIEKTLDVPMERIYIEFSNAQRHMFGWNGNTF